jgi:hypothetical protein
MAENRKEELVATAEAYGNVHTAPAPQTPFRWEMA